MIPHETDKQILLELDFVIEHRMITDDLFEEIRKKYKIQKNKYISKENKARTSTPV